MSAEKRRPSSTVKLLAVVEATTVNAVAKNMLEFHRSARELKQKFPNSPTIETGFVTFDRAAASLNEFVIKARQLELNVEVISESNRFDPRVIPALKRIVKSCAPDILVTHQVKSHFLIKLSRLWRRYPWVAFHHGYTTTDRKMRAYNHLDRWSLPSANKIITVCEAFAHELSLAGVPPERIHVQHNSIRPEQGASAEEVQALKSQLGIAEGERMILAVGRLSREKAHIDLLAGLNLLRETNPEINAKLIIVGDGPERGRLQEAGGSFGLSERVIFTGQVSNVKPYYYAADAFVLPSHSEGSPYVLLEAMAANLPIIATAVGGVPEMVEDNESALLVPPHDPRPMAEAIARVLADDELARRLAAKASALVATRYSPETYARSLIQIYREVLSSRTAALQ